MREVTTQTHAVQEVTQRPSSLDDALFSSSPASLPRGTKVYDAVAGLEFVVGEEPISAESLESYVGKTVRQLNGMAPSGTKADIREGAEPSQGMSADRQREGAAPGGIGQATREEDGPARTLLADEGVYHRSMRQRVSWMWAFLVLALALAAAALTVVLARRYRRQARL